MSFAPPYDELQGALRYDFMTELSPGVWKICRKRDRMEYLAHDITEQMTTDPSNATENATDLNNLLASKRTKILDPVLALLNHENLVSLVDWFSVQSTNYGRLAERRFYAVWDFCDAGNLGNLLGYQWKYLELVPRRPLSPEPEYPSPEERYAEELRRFTVKKTKFLPEALCWHVLISVLKALAWLHDGSRQVEQRSPGRYKMTPDPDWEPILHRDITANNIFFSHPRRSETYGSCRLGNYGSVTISSHHHGGGKESQVDRIRGKALGPPLDSDFRPLEELVRQDANFGYTHPLQPDQPYTIVSEWRAFGEIMQAMMVYPKRLVGHTVEVTEYPVHYNLEHTDYSDALKNAVVMLMTLNPDEKSEDGSYRFMQRECLTSWLCADSFEKWVQWRASDDPETRRLVTGERELARQVELDRLERELSSVATRLREEILEQQTQPRRTAKEMMEDSLDVDEIMELGLPIEEIERNQPREYEDDRIPEPRNIEDITEEPEKGS